MKLTEKIKKAILPTIAGAMILTGIGFGLRADYTRFARTNQAVPEIQREFFYGNIINYDSLDRASKEKVDSLAHQAYLDYSVCLGLALGGSVIGAHSLVRKL